VDETVSARHIGARSLSRFFVPRLLGRIFVLQVVSLECEVTAGPKRENVNVLGHGIESRSPCRGDLFGFIAPSSIATPLPVLARP